MSAAIPVLVNAHGGAASRLGDGLRETVEQAFAAAGLAIDFAAVPGDAMAREVARRKGGGLVVVGGGDGTLGSAAGELAGTDAALGILPLGTRNHLARELGVPPDLGEAAKLIADRTTRRIDIGRVNGRVFVNNASIGLYPELVRQRDDSPAPKWLAAVPASLKVLGRLRHHRLRLAVPGRERAVTTPLLLIGNNRYALGRGEIGSRAALDDGVLSIYAVAASSRAALVGLALRTLAGRARPSRDFAAIAEAAELTVAAHARHLHAALDGEVMRLETPLRFASDAGALTVVAPLSGPEASTRSPA